MNYKAIYRTFDKMSVTEGDTIHVIKSFKIKAIILTKKHNFKKLKYVFSSKRSAQKWLVLNKPCLSIIDIKNCETLQKMLLFVQFKMIEDEL